MKVAGIIAEYNPFHNGHKYQLEQVRKRTDADYIIIAMSGDFLQRGVPALSDKHTRARMALSAGADLVLELPTVWAKIFCSRWCRAPRKDRCRRSSLLRVRDYGYKSVSCNRLCAFCKHFCRFRQISGISLCSFKKRCVFSNRTEQSGRCLSSRYSFRDNFRFFVFTQQYFRIGI